MLIPLNTKKSVDLCLSVIQIGSGSKRSYSVAIMNLVNGLGMYGVPSYRCYDPDDENEQFATVTAMTDYEVIKGNNLYDCIEGCLDQLRKSGEL
jgi:hypothetical protein